MRRRWLYIATAAIHLLLVFSIAARDLFRSLAAGDTLLSQPNEQLAAKAAAVVNCSLGQCFPRGNLLRETVPLYLNCVGAEAGYNFFAPHVPASYRLVFALHYMDGRVEYTIPRGQAVGSEVRLASLLDVIGHFEDQAVREGLIRLLAQDVWQQHPNLTMVRALFGTVNFPAANRYERGLTEDYTVLYSLDFNVDPRVSP